MGIAHPTLLLKHPLNKVANKFMSVALGIDFGTSGARAIAINAQRQIIAETNVVFPANIPAGSLTSIWSKSLFILIKQIPEDIRRQITRISINGTSSTVFLCNDQGGHRSTILLYNDDRAKEIVPHIRQQAPENHPVISATSSLAKLLWLFRNYLDDDDPTYYLLHQADWLGYLFHRKIGISDYHNALKLGYDVVNLCYPQWLLDLLSKERYRVNLPQVLAPGTIVGKIAQDFSTHFRIPKDCQICTGTTDSIAAFLASGAKSVGEAVTSLGSTLVIKLLSHHPVEDTRYGIYSHRLGDLWLVGGASNTGGAVLKKYFSSEELKNLSQEINPDLESDLDYYPLLKPGDRFPYNDPNLLPKITPIPDNKVEFLHGLLESIARIEAKGYELLTQLGATPVTCVYTSGGGADNSAWTKIRSRQLQIPVTKSLYPEAAYGTALLAMLSS